MRGCTRRSLLATALLAGPLATHGANAGDEKNAGNKGSRAGAFVDPLDAPAPMRQRLLSNVPMTSIATAGKALVAAGPRGLILRREAGAANWTQATVPASCDLTALHFPAPDQGWCVGHDGLVLHSTDGGRHWSRVMDGRDLVKQLASRYQVQPKDMTSERWDDAQAMARQGPVHPWLDLFFMDERRGWIVGAFGLVIHTRDGGASWEPWLERVDNPRGLHLYGMRRVAGALLLVGEQGLLLRLDENAERFTALPSPYRGSLFGVVGNERIAVIYGMRGNVFISRDRAASWQALSGIVPAGVTGGTVLADGRVLLVTQAAQLVEIDASGQSPRVRAGAQPGPYSAVAALSANQLGVAGSFGVAIETLKS